MNLEALPKYYSPKSPKLSDDAPATGTGCLTITDVMAAQGMVQSKAPLGLALFLAKVGVQDPQFAIEGLLNYAMALDNPTLNKLSEETRPSDGSKHHLALILLSWLIKSQFKERLLLHGWCFHTEV